MDARGLQGIGKFSVIICSFDWHMHKNTYNTAICLPIVICTVGCVKRIIRIVEGGWQLVIGGDVPVRRLLACSMSSDSSIGQDGEMEVIRVH